MLNWFQWFSVICILVVAWAGGYYPLFRPERARRVTGIPLGQAFAAGVFLALSLTIMLPAGYHLFRVAFPEIDYPLASIVAIAAYLLLLAMGHVANAERARSGETDVLSSPIVPVIMTIMIAIPSFLLGAALGVSATSSAVLIFFAILAHKGSAGFAIALAMVRSTMSRPRTLVLYALFAFATPVGICVGADAHRYLTGHTMLVIKAAILSGASGVFLYMGTLHEMKHAPLIVHCCTRKGFAAMLLGLIITALVRLILGLAHTAHPG